MDQSLISILTEIREGWAEPCEKVPDKVSLRRTLHKMQCPSPLVLDFGVVGRYEEVLDGEVGNKVVLGEMVFSEMVSRNIRLAWLQD